MDPAVPPTAGPPPFFDQLIHELIRVERVIRQPKFIERAFEAATIACKYDIAAICLDLG